jgi:hypothetical protein
MLHFVLQRRKTWLLSIREKNNLRLFENIMLRSISGLKRQVIRAEEKTTWHKGVDGR